MITDPARKEKVVEKYKCKMGQIACRWFDYGRGTCPFGTSCFYAHLNEDGTPFVAPKLRYLETGYGEVQIMKTVQLSDFLE
jgi:E3 ubiquitin-protein ligase makorin